MSELPSGNQVAQTLINLSNMLDQACTELDQADEEAVRAKQAYEVARARAFTHTKGTVGEREAKTTLAVESEKLDKELAEHKHRAVKERIRTLHAQIEIQRSLGAAARSEYDSGNMKP